MDAGKHGNPLAPGEITAVRAEQGRVCGVRKACGAELSCRALVLATGVYLKSPRHYWRIFPESGPFDRTGGQQPGAPMLRERELGLALQRFKTGDAGSGGSGSSIFPNDAPNMGIPVIPFPS